jgi:hypothetical protein
VGSVAGVAGNWPFPRSSTRSAGPGTLLVTTSSAARVSAVPGTKPTGTVQVCPAAALHV